MYEGVCEKLPLQGFRDSRARVSCRRRKTKGEKTYMKTKKLFAVLLSSAMVATSLAGLAVTVSAEDKVPLTALFCSHSLTQDVEDMEWVAEMEDEAGVDVTWEQIRADWDQVKATRFASGDIPDILFSATAPTDFQTYSGLFLDLNDYISEDLTPNIYAMFQEEPETKVLATSGDGGMYNLPKFQGKWPSTNTVLFINQTWLDNVGMEVPTTFTEFKEVLTAFKEQDANGNGDANDEIPLDFNAYGGNMAWFNSAYSLTSLIGSLGIQTTGPVTGGYFVEDSTVKCYAVDERYKLFMEYLADLYANGLINSNAITNDYSAYQSLSRGNEAGDAVVGCVFGWEETDKFGNNLASQYVPVPPLEYDIDCEPGTYDTRWRNDYAELNMSDCRVAIKASCENIEAALRFVDRFYDQTHSVETLFGGITDGCIEKTGDNSYKVLPPQNPDTDPGTWKWTSTFADMGPMYIRRSTEIEMAEDMQNALKEREVYEEALSKMTDADNYPRMFLKFSAEDESFLALTDANINNIIDNQWALWLTGEADIESTWDSYVESVDGAGLQDCIAIRQAAYDAYIASLE